MTHEPTGVRPSLLKVSRYCPEAPRLAKQYPGASTAALQSTVVHAIAAGETEKARKLMAQLSPEDQEEIQGWHIPKYYEFNEGEEMVLFQYNCCVHEETLGLDASGNYVASGKCLTAGTPDAYWHDVKGSTVYVLDLKKSKWTTLDGPSDLQIHCYGWAAARKCGARFYRTGVYVLETGDWEWGDAVDLESDEAMDVWAAISRAAKNTEGPAVTGAHCRECYQRSRCGQHLLPAVLGATELAALVQGGKLTPEGLGKAVLQAQALKDIGEAALDHCKALVRVGHEVAEGDREWAPQERKGKESVCSVKTLRAALGDRAEAFITQGQPYQVFSWRKR